MKNDNFRKFSSFCFVVNTEAVWELEFLPEALWTKLNLKCWIIYKHDRDNQLAWFSLKVWSCLSKLEQLTSSQYYIFRQYCNGSFFNNRRCKSGSIILIKHPFLATQEKDVFCHTLYKVALTVQCVFTDISIMQEAGYTLSRYPLHPFSKYLHILGSF